MTITIDEVRLHITCRQYMGGISRDKDRIKVTEEVFTPDWLVEQCLDDFLKENPSAFNDPTATFLDPCCGDGQMLGYVLLRKMQNGIDFETALLSLRGVDIMQDNVELCRERLLCEQEHLRPMLEQYIVCADALKYHYRFDGSPVDDELTEKENYDKLFNNFFK